MGFTEWLRSFFPRITQYRIEPEALQSMRAFARETHPKEMIALLRGRHEGNTLVVDELVFQPFENSAYSATIRMDPTLTNVVGTFHSHPIPDARPSAADKRLFSRHPGVHCIMPLPYTETAVYDQRARFLGVETVPITNDGAFARKEARAGRHSPRANP